ncbi:hypothetical protein PV325_003473 [Microctonus aethiopoides]|nr:hypothetical protein PV325_003473 [Microctonus aethiopoides]
MTIASNIVVEWLRSLHLGQYSESFIDNGYDDLEICKQIGDPDLDAIGVFNQNHRLRLLQSVKTLREEGAASVYFTLEETNDCLCDNVSSKSSRTSSERPSSDKDAQRASPTASSSSGGQELTKFADEYEEGKAELVRIPRMQLKMLLQEKLRHDGIRLACQPYTTPTQRNCDLVSHMLHSGYCDTTADILYIFRSPQYKIEYISGKSVQTTGPLLKRWRAQTLYLLV